MPYVLLRQDITPDIWQARANDDLDLIELRRGTKIESIVEPVHIQLGEGSESRTDFLESPYFIMSNAMREAFEGYGINNIDYFKSTLINPTDGTEHTDFWLGNVLGLVSCVDEENSNYKNAGGRHVLRGFAVDEKVAQEQALFRLKENSRLILISTNLQEHLQQSGLVGIYFQDTQAFDGKPASSFW